MKREAAPQQGQMPPAQAPGATPGKRSWLGPIAGLAAGLGLAALFSHLGLGEGMANFLMLALLVLAAVMLVRWLMRRSQASAERPMAYAGARPAPAPDATPAPARFDAGAPLPGSPAAMTPAQASLPPGFDAAAFERQAKVNFIRLQAAHDAGNLDDIREFTTPEMYAEIKLDIDGRAGAASRTEVVTLESRVLEAVEENGKQVVSVRYTGLIREDSDNAEPFDEIWHLSRPAHGKGGWVVAGIQQAS
jgi:predicted lipid-binding transport protein (Tim44 family)